MLMTSALKLLASRWCYAVKMVMQPSLHVSTIVIM